VIFEEKKRFPLAYLITFACYGTHLPGHRLGSVTGERNHFGEPLLEPDPHLERIMASRLKWPPYRLDRTRRRLTLDAVEDACQFMQWTQLATHVRSSHVHSVVRAACPPERVLQKLKGRASFHLNEARVDGAGPIRRWVKGGSRRYLWEPDDVAAAINYVIFCQGALLEFRIGSEAEDWVPGIRMRVQELLGEDRRRLGKASGVRG
jgi:REP element-mobilizing transposase RayT